MKEKLVLIFSLLLILLSSFFFLYKKEEKKHEKYGPYLGDPVITQPPDPFSGTSCVLGDPNCPVLCSIQ